MTPLTALVSLVGDRIGPPVERLDFDGIQRARARVLPRNPVSTAYRGTDPSVGITYGTAPARDDHEIPLRIYRPRALRDARTTCRSSCGSTAVLGARQRRRPYDPTCTFIAAAVGLLLWCRSTTGWRRSTRAPVAVEDCVDATTWVGGQRRRAAGRHLADGGAPATRPAATSRPSSAQVLRDHGDHPAAAPGADLPGDRPDHGVARRSREHAERRPCSPSASMDAFRDHYVAGGARPARPAALPAVRPARRPAAGPGPDRRPRPAPRRRHPLRRGAAGGRRAGAAHELPPGARTASPRCRARRRPWGASSGGSWPRELQPPRSDVGVPTDATRLAVMREVVVFSGVGPHAPSPTASATSWG